MEDERDRLVDPASLDDPGLYKELRAVASREFRRQPSSHTLQVTALVNEAWMRVADRPDGYESRSHFLFVAAKAMRHILVDHSRRRRTQKRGGEMNRVTLLTSSGHDGPASLDVLDLDEALSRLEERDARQARVVELKFFAGMTLDEIAEQLGVSNVTVSKDWRNARVWLARELGK